MTNEEIAECCEGIDPERARRAIEAVLKDTIYTIDDLCETDGKLTSMNPRGYGDWSELSCVMTAKEYLYAGNHCGYNIVGWMYYSDRESQLRIVESLKIYFDL